MALVGGLVALASLGWGCRKERSSEYFSAKGRLDSLVGHLGDDAYADPEIDAVIAELRAVRPSAVEYPDAVVLLAKVQAERERRVAAAARVTAVAAAPSSPGTESLSPPAVVDAGVGAGADSPDDRPAGGMTEEAFKERFGACFGAPRRMVVPGEPEEATAYPLQPRQECRARYGALPFSYLFVRGKLTGTVTEAPAPMPDAGSISPQPAKPPPPPAPPPQGPTLPAGPTGVEGYDGTPRGEGNPYDGTPRPPS